MLAKSKLSSAPRSDRSSWARSRASRSSRSPVRSTRCSQSTALGPKVGMAIVYPLIVRGSLGADRATEVERADLRVAEHLLASAGEPDPAVLQHHPAGGQLQAGAGVLLAPQHGPA